MKVLDLQGVHLAYWVAQAQDLEKSLGIKFYVEEGQLYAVFGLGEVGLFAYRPDLAADLCMEIINRERISLLPQGPGGRFDGIEVTQPHWLARHPSRHVNEMGSSAMEAALRAYVASAFGDTVPHDGNKAQALSMPRPPRYIPLTLKVS